MYGITVGVSVDILDQLNDQLDNGTLVFQEQREKIVTYSCGLYVTLWYNLGGFLILNKCWRSPISSHMQ